MLIVSTLAKHLISPETHLMLSGLLWLHSILRWVIMLLLILSIVRSFSGWQQKKELGAGDAKLFLFTMISAHTTLLVGIILLVFGRFGISNGLPPGVQLMKDPFYRFYWVEHPVAMLLATAFITMGRGQVKKIISSASKYKKIFWFMLLALIIIIAVIPWPGKAVVGRPLLP